ncbi:MULTISPECIES: FHA domain-containing protein [unclassified Pseudomonas]|uniref:SctD/MshK family protein n=1 Tax=unclassified Pseudomonas TaxID=196821 RepID=UPI001F56D3FB|nr:MULTISPECIES: FHA domain-containing protein [unclassified Pseudomonas]
MTALISLGPVAGIGAPTLTVTGGLHQGSSLVLDQPVYTLGADLAADLVLSDPGIAGLHLRLRFEGDQVAVEALGGDVLLSGNVRIPHGSGHRARLPVQLRLGAAGVSLALPEGAQKPSDARRPFTPWSVAIVLLFLCAGALAVRNDAPIAQTAVTAADVPVLKKPPRELAKAWLEQQLQAAHLDAIKVTNANGQLSAVGSFEQSQKPQWLALQQAFDQRYGQQIVLNPRVAVRADAARPRVRFQAVWFGTHPYVINDSGKRLYPGAALADNWVLERIENNQVILARGEERFTFTL